MKMQARELAPLKIAQTTTPKHSISATGLFHYYLNNT